MAKQFFAGICVLLSLILLAASGCADDPSVADSTLPPPGFATHVVQQSAPTPAPAPRLSATTPPAAAPQSARQQTALRGPVAPPQRRIPSLSSGIPADWIPKVPANKWQWIIIHHTATAFGNAAIVTQWHVQRGFDEMGYHFLIGNGTNSGDGQIEVGTRWPKQKWGAHTKSDDNRFNLYGIGICLVGNFDITRPTAAQMRSLDKLVAYLMKTYHIPPDRVLGHNDCKSTDCPGKNLNVAVVRNAAVQMLADAGDEVPQDAQLAADEEMIHDAPSK
jgi:hypothetical protein